MTPEEFTARYMPQFSEQQKAAVRETEGPVLLLAVAGVLLLCKRHAERTGLACLDSDL